MLPKNGYTRPHRGRLSDGVFGTADQTVQQAMGGVKKVYSGATGTIGAATGGVQKVTAERADSACSYFFMLQTRFTMTFHNFLMI